MTSYRAKVAEAIKADDMEGLYSLAVECALIADKKTVAHAMSQNEPYSPPFEEAWALYPRRSGANPKREAWGAWNARLRSKKLVAPIDMIQGVKRYAAWCDATGKTGTETVMQARRFFGPSECFKEQWVVGAPQTPTTQNDKPDFKYIAGVINARRAKADGDAWWETCEKTANAQTYRDLLLFAYRHV